MPSEVVVAGHLALDMIPALPETVDYAKMFAPGNLMEVGKAKFATGGCISNTGLALDRLGAGVKLIGRVGEDEFGKLTLDLMKRINGDLIKDLIVVPGETSSYTLVLNFPGADRIFLHCPGANDSFSASDIHSGDLTGTRWFHFGYPPLMKRMAADSGREMVEIFRKARKSGLVTSLDMAMPGSECMRMMNWKTWLAAVLPEVDIFIPSLEEIMLMLKFNLEKTFLPTGKQQPYTIKSLLQKIAFQLLQFGCRMVVLKLGELGLYCRTSREERMTELEKRGIASGSSWHDREIWAPCFRTKVVGTTGAGDCTIAGFIKAMLLGMAPEKAVNGAVAVGACNVEALDAISGITTWDQVQKRIEQGWERLPVDLSSTNWSWDEEHQLWKGPNDNRSFH